MPHVVIEDACDLAIACQGIELAAVSTCRTGLSRNALDLGDGAGRNDGHCWRSPPRPARLSASDYLRITRLEYAIAHALERDRVDGSSITCRRAPTSSRRKTSREISRGSRNPLSDST